MNNENQNKTNKFRAFYKPDFTTPGGPLLFEQKIVDDELFFVCKKDSEIKYDFSIPFLDNDWVLQQFTGILDKNGQEIYEGDVVDCPRGSVVYSNRLGGFFIKYPENTNGWIDFTGCSIIGNIFENPEFLEKQNS